MNMKRILGIVSVMLVIMAVLLGGCGGSSATSSQGQSSAAAAAAATKVKLSFEGGEAIAELQDNPTSRSLIAQLPVTIQFKDFNETEKIAYTPATLSQEGAPKGFEPKAGDVAVFGPWGNVSVFYKAFRYSEGLIPMGHITSGLDALAKKQGEFDVTLSVVE